MVTGLLPTGREIRSSVMGKLTMTGGVTGNMVPFSMTFSPTLVIAAGRINKLEMDIRSFHEPLLRSVRDVLTVSIRENFNVGGRPAWEPLSEATMNIRAAYGFDSASPLVWTGNLRRVASQINIWTITQSYAVIADLPAVVWYGKIHQAGFDGSGGGKKVKLGITPGERGRNLRKLVGNASSGQRPVSPIPARQFVVLQPEDEDNITNIFIKWLGERVMHAWPGVEIG